MRWPWSKKPASSDNRYVVGKFVVQSALAGSSGRSMAIEGSVYSDDDLTQINSRLDVCQEAIERQRVRSEIPELQAKREQMLKSIEQAREVLADLEKRQSEGMSLSSQERMNIGNMRTSVKKMLDEVDKGTAAIEEAKKKAGVG